MKPYGRRVLIQASVRRTAAIVQQLGAQLHFQLKQAVAKAEVSDER
jgi:hypothetical protein